jgi:transposase-like protein
MKLTRATIISNPDAAMRAIQCLLEGCSIRSTERLTGLNRNTIMRLLILAGQRSEKLREYKKKVVLELPDVENIRMIPS